MSFQKVFVGVVHRMLDIAVDGLHRVDRSAAGDVVGAVGVSRSG